MVLWIASILFRYFDERICLVRKSHNQSEAYSFDRQWFVVVVVSPRGMQHVFAWLIRGL